MENNYNQTISTSKEESMLKALSMLDSELNKDCEKEIKRPDINTKKIITIHSLWLVITALLVTAFFIFANHWDIPAVYSIPGTFAFLLILLLLRFKKIVIDFVLLYQKLAPEKLRRSCVFTPTCSDYMLQAVDKYGAFKGFFKGIKRLLRCHHPNGGIDYP